MPITRPPASIALPGRSITQFTVFPVALAAPPTIDERAENTLRRGAGVTGGVAEALIATALGLFIALVALFAFNYFSHRQAEVLDEMERLGTRLVDHIRLDQEGAGREAA